MTIIVLTTGLRPETSRPSIVGSVSSCISPLDPSTEGCLGIVVVEVVEPRTVELEEIATLLAAPPPPVSAITLMGPELAPNKMLDSRP